jgi:hypothetical protein
VFLTVNSYLVAPEEIVTVAVIVVISEAQNCEDVKSDEGRSGLRRLY